MCCMDLIFPPQFLFMQTSRSILTRATTRINHRVATLNKPRHRDTSISDGRDRPPIAVSNCHALDGFPRYFQFKWFRSPTSVTLYNPQLFSLVGIQLRSIELPRYFGGMGKPTPRTLRIGVGNQHTLCETWCGIRSILGYVAVTKPTLWAYVGRVYWWGDTRSRYILKCDRSDTTITCRCWIGTLG